MTRTHRAAFTVLVALIPVLIPAVGLMAQARNERSVRAVVDSFFAAVAREEWDSAATFIDLPRFEPILKQQIASARGALPQPPVTAEQLMTSDSTMPRAVAEWEADRANRFHSQQPFDDYSYQFAGVTSQHMLFSLTLSDALARWIAAQDARVQIREMWRRAGCALGNLPPAPPVAKPTMLAIAFRDDSTALVIHSDDRFGGQTYMPDERVVPVRLTRSGWRIEPRDDLLRPHNMSFGFGGCPKK